MVIHNFYALRRVVFPNEANTVFVVDANTVLTFAVTFKGFKSIRWRNFKLV